MPVLSGGGERPDNPTLLDRPYWVGWFVVVGLVAVGVGAFGLLESRHQSPRGRYVRWMDNSSADVDAWFASYTNPQKDLVQAVREVVLGSDARVTEAIKWQAPTFMYAGNIASFYPKATKHVSLMFHQGASLPDPDGLLEGTGDTSRVAKFADAQDLATKAEALRALIRAWIASRS